MIYDAATENVVKGEVYELTDPVTVLAHLDAYEGIEGHSDDEYVRRCLPVETPKGPKSCWAYVFNLSPDGLSRVESGYWVE